MARTLEALRGRVLDLDSHEEIPPSLIGEVWGDRGKRFAEVSPQMRQMIELMGADAIFDDRGEITEQSVWGKKLHDAPSHADMDRRPAVMDMMGIQRQMVFPTTILAAVSQALGGLYLHPSDEERDAAWGVIDAYNEWAAALSTKYPNRMNVAGILGSAKAGATPEGLAEEAAQLIKMGLKA